ncbi:hypothetical protein Poli38472_013615 [Pythium oligandrum]|uniref:Uncharacterized protein n=1 Tax=Pythium oligandrum TaxID=41045 RepID=A0A8K1CFC2_PYTOL|nr:hypothetical protein Poli38472_013615 [Pythium oligandrum]|eukprot:TMW61152.1 hypothetical protein Poli38472_013615 [Pythium oligandrum]
MSADDDEAAQRAWEAEMEAAIADRGRTRSRSILATTTSSAEDEPEEDGGRGGGRRGRGDVEPRTGREKSRSAERMVDVDVEDGGHDPNWLNSPAGTGSSLRNRARSFTANRVLELESPAIKDADPAPERRRSQSFTAMNARRDENEEDNEQNDMEEVARRAASLSKIYMVGSAPVDVSKLQDESKIVGVKKVEVVEPTGALSSKALDALSEGLQSLSVENSALGNGGAAGIPALGHVKDESTLLSEAELEEKKMAEEEDKKLKSQKLSSRKTLSEKASFFRAKMFKSSKATDPASTGTSTSTSLTGPPPNTTAASSAPTTTALTVATVAKDTAKTSPTDVAPVVAPSAPIKRHKLKLLLLGDSGVGKTSLMRVFSGDEFSESMLATAGVDFKLRNIALGDEEIALQIWDTAGQERFHRITATYYKGANGIVLVYDVTDKKSFDNVGYWMNNIRQYASPHMPAMLLVGNKIDLPKRVVSTEEGLATAKQYNVRFIETSAKTSENTNGALETIARDAFYMSVNPNVSQKMLMEKEKSLLGRRNKENCVIS